MSGDNAARLTRRAVLLGAAAAVGARAVHASGTPGRLEAPAAALQGAHRLTPPPSWAIGDIGRSGQGRPITRWTWQPSGAIRHVLVIAGIHGNERITFPLAYTMLGAARPSDMMLSIIPSANPDGWANNNRRNASGVDLNRNFPWRWRPSDGGPGPGSEPETKALMNVINAERPDLVIWIHQPLAYVAPLAGCPSDYASVWANAVGDRVRFGLDQHGGGETWTGALAGVRSMLVEIESWKFDQPLIDAHRAALEQTLRIVRPV